VNGLFRKLLYTILLVSGLAAGVIAICSTYSLTTGLSSVDKQTVSTQEMHILVICASAFVIAVCAGVLCIQRLGSTVDALKEGSNKLTKGEFGSRIAVRSDDELGELATNFNILAQMLEQHDIAHKQWITDTSHELRTPIAVLRAQVEALQDEVQKVDQKTLGILHREIMTLSKLVNDLHDLAKSDVGALKLDAAPVDVIAVLKDAIESAEERFRTKNISVDTSEIDGLTCIVEADEDRLKQLYANLLANSRGYTNEGGTLKVSGTVDSKNVVIRFDDSAPTVASAELVQLFERFFRADESRSRSTGGTGLGLAICKTIAEGHGGSIGASHSPLGGLRIELSLPIYKGASNV